MVASHLRADCARCAALCCVALAFDRSEHFAFDKKAGEACPNLGSSCRCRIHDTLEKSGFGGCAAYECHGAGQVVTQQIFGGRAWREDPRLLKPMMEAFAQVKAIHETRLLLAPAMNLALPSEERAALENFADLLSPAGGWTRAQIARGAGLDLVAEVQRHLRKLKPYARPQQ